MTLPPPTFTDFFTHLGFSLSSVWHWTKCFPSDPNKLNLLSSLKWTLVQFCSVDTTCSSTKVSLAFWFFLLMRGFVTAECTFSPTYLKRAEIDPYPVLCWTGKQFQLQCWTDSPLRVSGLSCCGRGGQFSFVKLWLNRWCHVDYFNNVLAKFLNFDHGSILQGQRALRILQKYLTLCSEDERRSYGFGTTWGWVINDRIFIFGWTIPLRKLPPGARLTWRYL